MDDVIGYGKDREPRWQWRGPRRPRWWRRPAVVAACIIVAAAAALVWSLPGLHRHGGHTGPGARGLSSAAQASRSVDTAPDPLSTRPALMKGQPLPRVTSLRLLLGGLGPAWLLLPSGRAEQIGGLPERGSGYQFVRIAGGWAAQQFPGYPGGCDTCAPSPTPVYYVANGSRAATRVGTADAAAAAAASGALWLVSYRRGANMSTAAGTAREVSVTGAALGPRVRLPAGYAIDQGTRAGLLLVQEQPGSGPVRYELWDPGTQRVTRSFADVIAASPTEIAWKPACTASCRVRVLDLPDGRTEEISLPRRVTPGEGAFSPDGRLLALLVTAGVRTNGYPAVNRLLVATVASGRIAAVPGTKVGSGIGVDFGWQPGSRLLLADVGVTAQGQLGGQIGPEWQVGIWQPGAARLSTAIARGHYDSWPVLDQGPY